MAVATQANTERFLKVVSRSSVTDSRWQDGSLESTSIATAGQVGFAPRHGLLLVPQAGGPQLPHVGLPNVAAWRHTVGLRSGGHVSSAA